MKTDQFGVHVTLEDGTSASFSTHSGGDKDSDETKYIPGALEPEIALGGSPHVTNVVCKRLFDQEVQSQLVKWLAAVGKRHATCQFQPFDADGNPDGQPIVRTGVLKRVSTPDADSNANAAAEFEIEVSTDGSVV